MSYKNRCGDEFLKSRDKEKKELYKIKKGHLKTTCISQPEGI